MKWNWNDPIFRIVFPAILVGSIFVIAFSIFLVNIHGADLYDWFYKPIRDMRILDVFILIGLSILWMYTFK